MSDHFGIPPLQRAKLLEEICALARRLGFVVVLRDHADRLEADRRAERVRREGRMRRTGREDARRNQVLARPHAAQRIQSVGQRLSEDEDVGGDAEVLDRPELAGAKEAHLDLIVDQQHVTLVENLAKSREITWRRDDVAARPLNWLDIE